MESIKTLDDERNKRIETLGKEFGSLYDSIYNEFVWLSFKWVDYKELFAKKKSRIVILNETAPFFFFTIQKILWENILLGICILSDPPKTGGKKNATIKALPDFINDEILRKNVHLKTKKLMEATEFCRDWRNRYISHKDYHLATDENAKPLKKATTEKLNNAFTLFQEFINLFQNHYFGTYTDFDVTVHYKDAISLLYVLAEGIGSRKQRKDRIKSGNYSDSDSDLEENLYKLFNS